MEGLAGKSLEGTFGVMEMCYISIRMVVTQECTFVNPCQSLPLKEVHFTGCESYLY